MARTLAVANQKGGVAKTTTVACLGVALSDLGRRVLLVDVDPQACLTFSLGIDPDDLPMSIFDVFLGRVSAGMARLATADGPDLLPAAIDLAGAEKALLSRPGREFVLRDALAPLAAGYDDILIDAPPSLGMFTVNALTAADSVLVPLQCETLSHRGVGQLLDVVADVRRLANPDLAVLGVLPTLFDPRTRHARAVLADISERYGLPVLAPAIPRSVRFAEAPAVGRSVLSAAPKLPGVLAYRELAARLVAAAGAPASPISSPDDPALGFAAPAGRPGVAAPTAPLAAVR